VVPDTELAETLRWLKSIGAEFGQCCVVPQGVLFMSERQASIFAEKHKKDLVRVEGDVSGWLAKNRNPLP
jgi:hypothetical protein